MKIDHNLSAIITGGASGLGAATAARLSAKGVRVAIFDSNAEAGQKMANEINGLFIQTDVSNAQSVAESLAQARAQNGQEHICINCAGIAPAAKTVSRGTA